MKSENRMLRRMLAAIAYRTQKAVADAPAGYGDFRAGPGVRTPRQIVRHMTDVLVFARSHYTGVNSRATTAADLGAQLERFHQVLADLDDHIESAPPQGTTPERLLQGPLADAMSHAGQLAMLRRLAGHPVPPENFIEADIENGRVGSEQPLPASPDAEWYDAEDEPW